MDAQKFENSTKSVLVNFPLATFKRGGGNLFTGVVQQQVAEETRKTNITHIGGGVDSSKYLQILDANAQRSVEKVKEKRLDSTTGQRSKADVKNPPTLRQETQAPQAFATVSAVP